MKCCICGTVRNCGPYLDKIFQNMELIGGLFNQYKIILYYDISNDDTLQKLVDYQRKNTNVILHINTEPLSPYRTHRIAKGRNKCLEIIREIYSDYDHFIMMDCDDRCAKPLNIQLLNMYLYRNDWDALSFNHPDGYYDSWALSKFPFILSCHHFRDPAQGQRMITNLIRRMPKNKLIKCISAFNGFAIYKTHMFLNCYYDGRMRLDYIPKNLIKANVRYAGKFNLIDKDGTRCKEDCEHRFFHFQAIMKNSARIRIAPVCIFRKH